VLQNRVIYSGDNIIDAAAGFDSRSGGPVVHITLDARGAAINQRITGDNIGRRMAVVYIEVRSDTRIDADGQEQRVRERIEEVITAPVIRSQLGKRFQIEGLPSIEEARELALLLRAGSLATPQYIVEQRTIGPSLGADNVSSGFMAMVIGMLLTFAFMIVYYTGFGLIACTVLVANVVLLVALMSMLQASLSLPGIAGIVLTIGMAADANVLIYERIREELRSGNSPQAAINAGFDKAFSAIADSNVTTLIAGIVLFTFGTGPIKGFAVTLILGIATSLFTAILGSRSLIDLVWGSRRKLKTLPV
jgi:preprotein translocase subunit SecD